MRAVVLDFPRLAVLNVLLAKEVRLQVEKLVSVILASTASKNAGACELDAQIGRKRNLISTGTWGHLTWSCWCSVTRPFSVVRRIAMDVLALIAAAVKV